MSDVQTVVEIAIVVVGTYVATSATQPTNDDKTEE